MEDGGNNNTRNIFVHWIWIERIWAKLMKTSDLDSLEKIVLNSLSSHEFCASSGNGIKQNSVGFK